MTRPAPPVLCRVQGETVFGCAVMHHQKAVADWLLTDGGYIPSPEVLATSDKFPVGVGPPVPSVVVAGPLLCLQELISLKQHAARLSQADLVEWLMTIRVVGGVPGGSPPRVHFTKPVDFKRFNRKAEFTASGKTTYTERELQESRLQALKGFEVILTLASRCVVECIMPAVCTGDGGE